MSTLPDRTLEALGAGGAQLDQGELAIDLALQGLHALALSRRQAIPVAGAVVGQGRPDVHAERAHVVGDRRGDLGAHGPRRPGGRPGGSSAGRHGSGADECDEQHGRAYPSSQARRHRITAPPRQRMNRSHAAATNSGCSIWATWPLSGSTTT